MVPIASVHLYVGRGILLIVRPVYVVQWLSVMPNVNPVGTSVISGSSLVSLCSTTGFSAGFLSPEAWEWGAENRVEWLIHECSHSFFRREGKDLSQNLYDHADFYPPPPLVSTLCEVIRTLSMPLFPSSLPISPRIMQMIKAGLLGVLESGGCFESFGVSW